jgi:hypothetical protein
MEAACFYETPEQTYRARCKNPGNYHFKNAFCGKLKNSMLNFVSIFCIVAYLQLLEMLAASATSWSLVQRRPTVYVCCV